MHKKLHFAVSLAATAAVIALPAITIAQDTSGGAQTTEIDGKKLYSNWNVVQNVTASPRHRKLGKAIGAAGLVNDLSGPGPFTIFAPTDKAFAAVPKMTSWLMKPTNGTALGKVLKFHILPGRLDADELFKRIEGGGGKIQLTTLDGEKLTFTENQGNIKIEGTQGSLGFITQSDIAASNGVIHIVNGLLMPTLP